MNLLNTLKQRHEAAKAFTKDFQDNSKKNVKDYEAQLPSDITIDKLDYVETVNNRYKFIIPMIFTFHESMQSSMFDRIPDLIFTAKGKLDEEKKNKVKAAYDYLNDKLDLEWFMNDVAWWFILNGFASAHATYKKESVDIPQIDEITGEQAIDPLTGEPLTITQFIYDDPVIEVGDPSKEYYSPESKFSVNGYEVPYYTREKLIDPQEIKLTYNKKVEPDASIEIPSVLEGKQNDPEQFKRTKTIFYCGDIPYENRGEVEDWQVGANYYIVFTNKTILYKERIDEKNIRLAKWYGAPNKFFGFGLGQLLRPFQKEKSLRRSQQARYGDVAAFPKIAVEAGSDVDEKTLNDPRENRVLFYSEKVPEYVTPPNLGEIVFRDIEQVDRDAQQASGLMDLSTASQSSSTVDTATGQTIFADAAERRVRMAKKKFVYFYKHVVIMLLKLAQKYWDEQKLLSITDEDGNDMELPVSKEDFIDIDFDTDIDVDGETLSVNKDVLRQQSIEVYNTTKDDPLVERKNVIKDMFRTGFNSSNPDRYVKDSQLQPGMQLFDAQGMPYIVDESGEVVPQEDTSQLGDPTQGGVPSSSPGIMGAAQQL